MNWEIFRYAELSDWYSVTWTAAKDIFHAALRGNPRDCYGGSLGNFDNAADAKAACVAHSEEAK